LNYPASAGILPLWQHSAAKFSEILANQLFERV
jgi:hypothetical protein